MAEELNLQLHHCRNLKTCVYTHFLIHGRVKWKLSMFIIIL